MWRSMSKKLEWLLIGVVMGVAVMLQGCSFETSDPKTPYITTSGDDIYLNPGSKTVSADLQNAVDGNVAQAQFTIVSYTSAVAPTITDVVQDVSTKSTSAHVNITEPGTYAIKANIGSKEKTFTLVVISTIDAGPDMTVDVGAAVTLTGNINPTLNGYWAAGYLGTDEPYLFGTNPLQVIPNDFSVTSIRTNSNVISFTAATVGQFTYYYCLSVIENDHLIDVVTSYVAVCDPVTITVLDPGSGGTPNTAPVADAGTPPPATVNNLVTLDGSASTDADGDPLEYSWSITVPSGSSASLTGANTVAPTFTPDLPGDYILSLVVNDGTVNSTAATLTVTAVPSGGGTATYVTDAITLLQNSTFLVSHSSAPNGLLEVFEFGPVGPGGSMSFAYIDPVSMPINRSSTWNVIDGGGFAMVSEAIMLGARYLNSAAPVDSTDTLTMTGYEGYATGLAGTSVENWIKAATVTVADFSGKTVVDYIDSNIQYVFTTATTGEYTADAVNPPQTFTWAIDSGGHKAVLTFSNGSTHSLYLTVRQAGFTTVREMGIVSANNTGFVSGGSLKSWRW